MDPEEFSQRMSRARGGDRAALDELLRHVGGKIRVAAHRGLNGRLRNHFDTSDLLQTTYVEVVKDIGAFKGSDAASFVAWISRVLENNLIDKIKYHRRAKRDPGIDKAENAIPVEEIVASDSTPSGAVIRIEQLRYVALATETLEGDQRRAFELRVLEHASYAEIAEQLGRTEGAVRMLVARARSAVSIKLDQMLRDG